MASFQLCAKKKHFVGVHLFSESVSGSWSEPLVPRHLALLLLTRDSVQVSAVDLRFHGQLGHLLVRVLSSHSALSETLAFVF